METQRQGTGYMFQVATFLQDLGQINMNPSKTVLKN